MKRFTFIFALLLSTVSMLAKEFTFGKLNFKTLSDTEVELVGAVDPNITNLDLNSAINYQGRTYSVTSIGFCAFHNCSSLTSIIIPNSVTSIGNSAFWCCKSLTSVTIPNSVTSIGEGAFYGTALYNEKSNWENSVLYISNCLIEAKDDISGAYIIKEGTRLIADGAFWDCESLTSITIPNSVTRIGSNAFPGCSGLTSITIPNSVTGIGHRAFYGCDGLTFITIPNSVTSIGEEAFWDCYKLKSITVPIHTTIGHNAFPDHTEIIRK